MDGMSGILADSESIQRALINDAASVSQMFVKRGMGLEQQGDLLRAIDDYDTALRITPNDASVMLRRGIAFSRKGDLDRAIANFDAALRVKPDFPEVFLARANIWEQKRQFERAINDFNEASRLIQSHSKLSAA